MKPPAARRRSLADLRRTVGIASLAATLTSQQLTQYRAEAPGEDLTPAAASPWRCTTCRSGCATWGGGEEDLAAIQEAVGIYRELAAGRPDAFRPDLASSLNNLAADLGALGRRDEALDAIQEAVTIRRELASRWPDAYRQELEQSLQAAARLEHSEGHSDSVPWDLKA